MRDQILASAQKLVQQRGFNGFSYADVAGEVGVRKASLHHHFPSKTDLGLALIDSYATAADRELIRIGASTMQADKKLRSYVALYRAALVDNRMCLCGILASEALTLDPAMLPQLNRFFVRNSEWLAEVLAEGKAQKVLAFSGPAADHARVFLSALQGALLMARASGDHAAFDRTAAFWIGGLSKPV